MKAAFLFLCVAISAVASQPYLKRGGYKLSGKYVYNYKMMMKVKLSEVKAQYTKVSMNSTIELHFLPEENEVILKIVKAVFNETIKDSDSWGKIVKPSPFTETLSKYLKMPVKFIYTYGVVSKVFAKAEDEDWSIDMKKSILNLFHVDMQGKDEETNSNSLFTKPEISLFGICNTTYRMMDYAVISPLGEKMKVGMNITKVIDITNCTLQKSESLNSVLRDPIGRMEREPMDTSAIIDYNIIGNEYKFKIESVNATGLMFFYPFSRKDGFVASVTKQQLRLLKESGSIVKMNHPEWLENLVEKGTLDIKMSPIEEPEFLWQWKRQDWNRLVDNIHDTITVFIKDFVPHVEPTAVMKNLTGNETETVLRMVNMLRLCREKHLEMVWAKCAEPISRRWLMYLISLCHTDECVKFMTKKIEKTNIATELIEEYLMSESFTSKPTRQQVVRFFNLCKISKINAVPHLKTVCYVATSNLVRTLCKTKSVCKTPFQSKILDMLKTLSTCKPEKKECCSVDKIPSTVLLAMVENIMIVPEIKPVFFVTLRKIIVREDLPMEVRVKAVLACKPIIKVMPAKVRILLLRIFQDIAIDTELRMIAFSVLMENPTPAIVEICARYIYKEPSNNVRRYVTEFYRSVAMEKPVHKYEWKIIRAFQLAIRFFYRSPFNMLFPLTPRHLEWKWKSRPLKMGSYWTMDSIISNASFIPRYISSKLNITVFGRNIPLLDAEMRMEGVQEYLNRLIGSRGIFTKKKSWMDLIRRKTRSIEDIYDEDYEAEDEEDPTIPRPDEELKVFSQVKLFDKLFFVNYTSLTRGEDLKTLFLKGAIFRAAEMENELKKGKVFSWFKPIVPVDVLYKLPTLLGIPLHCNLTAIIIPRIKSIIKAEVKPNLFSLYSLLSPEKESAEIGIKENVSVVSQISGGIYFAMPVYEVGIRMRSVKNMSMMFSGKASIDFKTMKSTYEIDLPEKERTFFSIKQQTYHFIKPTGKWESPLNKTVLPVRSYKLGELVFMNVTKPCNGCLYEEWIFMTKEGKNLTIQDNKVVPGTKPTVFRLNFHGKGRKFVSIEVPGVGHVTTSRKSNCLFINRDMNKKGKVFELVYKNMTAVMLKTWIIMEKKFLPKMWTIPPREILERHLHEYEEKRVWWPMHKEVMIEDEKLPYKQKHIQMAFVSIMDSKLCLMPEISHAEVFNITRNITFNERLRNFSRENAFCFGEYYHLNVCMSGYYTLMRNRPLIKSLISPGEFNINIAPLPSLPEKLIIKSEIKNIEKKESIPQFITLVTKIISRKDKVSTTQITIQTTYDMDPTRSFRVIVMPRHPGIFFSERICFEKSITKDNYSVSISMEKECKIKHLKIDLLELPFEMNRGLSKSLTFRLNYTTEKLMYPWQEFINTTIKALRPLLFWPSEKVIPCCSKSWDRSWKGSALVNFRLTSNKTIKTTIKTPRKMFIYKDMELPVYVEEFPKGSEEIPMMIKMKFLGMPYCQHMNTTFKTVDDKVYNFKLREKCEHVLMQNCSANMTSFSVMVRKAEENKMLRAVRVIVGDTEIDIAPKRNWMDKPVIKIDEAKLDFDTVYWKYDKFNKPIFTIMWEPKIKNVMFMDMRIGLVAVLRKGVNVRTLISPLYFNKVCGMCGNFDGETMNEFETPENHNVEDERLFGSSWIIPGAECGDACAKSRSHIELKRKETHHCKTSIPVAQCLEGCRPIKVERVIVPVTCVPDSEDNRQRLEDKLLFNKPIDIKNMDMALEEMDLPIECSCSCENKREWRAGYARF